jgi:ubiquitin carboxyl-terminal hydrolase 8
MANGVKANGVDGLKVVNRVFAHIDDLVSVKPNIDVHSPIRTILHEGELFAKQADTHLDFRRPDVALQEHVKATIVAADIIPRHKDYPSLQSDRGELHRSYTALMKRIKAQNDKFDDVKVLIKENNARSGVRPTAQRDSFGTASESLSNSLQNGHSRAQSVQHPASNAISTGPTNGEQAGEHMSGVSRTYDLSTGSSNGESARKKPPVQPKPEGLHGKALHSPSNSQVDLATRFARLRSPGVTATIQDPRIRTQPIQIPEPAEYTLKSPTTSQNSSQSGRPSTISRPTGPREMPSVPTTAARPTKIPFDVQIPDMPKPPDAIYSPARSTDTVTTINLPSSIPRNSSYLVNGKKISAPPISTVGPTPGSVEGKQDYFSPAHTLNNDGYSRRRQDPLIPESTTVTAEDLMHYIKMGSQSMRILLVDIRAREQFDSGHIMSQSIICVEPISLRHGISAEELGESIVLSPDSEQRLYDKRHEFDLIVFYNQSSTSIKSYTPAGNDNDSALQDFTMAIYDYGYDKQLKTCPRLLLGGLDAWVDLMGLGSLQDSSTGLTTSSRVAARKGPQPSQPLGRVAVTRDTRKYVPARRRTYESRPLSKEEESKWDASLREDNTRSPTAAESSSPDEFSYARTTEDFFRRYPELPAIQESMISPPSVPHINTYQNELTNSVPRPPARPAPALPRQRSSGLSEKGPSATYALTPGSQSSITAPKVTPGNTGLFNGSVMCYMNAAIQALSSTDFLREVLLHFIYPPTPRLPRKRGEISDPPQLMVRNLGNLLGHLWSGQYDYVTPKTFAVSKSGTVFDISELT